MRLFRRAKGLRTKNGSVHGRRQGKKGRRAVTGAETRRDMRTQDSASFNGESRKRGGRGRRGEKGGGENLLVY